MPLPADAVAISDSSAGSKLPLDAIPVSQMNQGGDNNYQELSPIINEQTNTGSPLTLIDSIKYGLADNKGKQKLLESKFSVVRKTEDNNFMVGNDPVNLSLVNPQGIFNDIPAKIAQHIGDINTIASSIAGASIGAGIGLGAGGVGAGPGAIGGSAIGGAVGTSANKTLAKLLGLNTQSPQEVATDIAIDGALMGAGEGVGQAINIGLKAAGNQIAAKGMIMAEKFVKDASLPATEQMKRAIGVADILHFTSGWNKEDIITILTNGARNTLVKDTTGVLAGIEKGSEEHAMRVIGLMKKGINAEEDRLGQQLGGAEKRFFNSISPEHIENTADIQMNIMQQLERLKLGKIVTSETTDGTPITYFQIQPKLDAESKKIVAQYAEHFDAFGGKVYKNAEKMNAMGEIVPVTGKDVSGLELNPEGKVDMGILRSRSASIERDIDSASRMGKRDEESTLINLKRGNTNPKFGAEVIGVDDTIARVAANSADGIEYLAAKKQFAGFKAILDGVRNAGMDIDNPLNMFNYLKSADKMNPVVKLALDNLDNTMNTQFRNSIAMWKAAESAKNTNVNFLRFGLVMSLTGLASLKQDSIPGKFGYAAAGLALATPKGSSEILKLGERIKTGGIKQGMNKIAGSTLLRRLLTQTSAKNVSNKLQKQMPQ